MISKFLSFLLISKCLSVYTMVDGKLFRKCKYGDSKCIAEEMNSFLRQSGDSGINLVKLDPLEAGNFTLYENKNETVGNQRKLILHNSQFHGLSKTTVKTVRGFNKNPQNENFEIIFDVPIFTIVGLYNLEGIRNSKPLKGNGNLDIKIRNLNGKISFKGKLITHSTTITKTEESNKYLRINNFTFESEQIGGSMIMENLYNGEDNLSEEFQDPSNGKFDKVYSKYHGVTDVSIGLIFGKVLENVFSNHPYNCFFEN